MYIKFISETFWINSLNELCPRFCVYYKPKGGEKNLSEMRISYEPFSKIEWIWYEKTLCEWKKHSICVG